jgi:hypothetical protein
MITVRDRDITLRPLGIFDLSRIMPRLQALQTCVVPEDMLAPDMVDNLLAVIVVAVRKQIPDATTEEVEEALTLANIGPVLDSISGITPAHVHPEEGHV